MLVRRLVATIALAGAVSMLAACTPDRKRSSSGDGPAGVAADEEKLHRAEADFLERNGRYGNEDDLVTQGFLAGASSSHDIVLENTGTLGVKPRYVVDCVTPGCGGPPQVDELRFQASGGFGAPTPFGANGSPNTLTATMMTLMFDTLTWRDASGPAPWLNVPATEVPAGMRKTPASGLVSSDGLRYRYVLRSGAKWHDGRPLTAADVVFTYEYTKNRKAAGFSIGFPPPGGPYSRYIDYIASVRVDPADPSGQTVLFTLHDPVASPCPAGDESCLLGPWVPFEDLVVGAVPIIPRHIWGPDATATCHPSGGAGSTCVQDPVNAAPQQQYLGSGPYVLDTGTFVVDELVAQLNANMEYFRGPPYVRKLNFVPVGQGQSLNALSTGVIDGATAGGGSAITPETLGSFDRFARVTGDRGEDQNIQFNLTRGFPFDRKEFRQAIAYAVDRPALVAAFANGQGVPGSAGALSPSSPAVAPDLPRYERDVEKANQLLDAIGLTDKNGDGMRDLPDEGCGIVPACPRGKGGTKLWSDSMNERLAEVVVDSLRRDLKLDIASYSPNPPVFPFGNYSMALTRQRNLTGDPDQLRTRFSHGITSQSFPGPCSSFFGCHKNPPIMVFGYANPEFMDLADQQAVDANPATRLEKVHRMQRLIAEDVPATSLMVADRLFLHRPSTVPFYYTPGGVGADPEGATTLNKQVFVTGKKTG